MLIKRKNNNFNLDFECDQIKKLTKLKGISHGFFNRNGGKSKVI